MIQFGVFVVLFSLAIKGYVAGQQIAPGPCGPLANGYNAYYQCVLRCYQQNFRINMVRGDFCSSTVQMRGSNKVTYSTRDVANSVQCITKECRFVVPQSACAAPIFPMAPSGPVNSMSNPDSTDAPITTAEPDYATTSFPDTPEAEISTMPSSSETTHGPTTTESIQTTENIFSSETTFVTSLLPETTPNALNTDSMMTMTSNDYPEMLEGETSSTETEECDESDTDDESAATTSSSDTTSANDDGDQGLFNIFSVFKKKTSSKRDKTSRSNKIPKHPRKDKHETSTLSPTTECDEDNSDDTSNISTGEEESSIYSTTPFPTSDDSSLSTLPSEESSSLTPTTDNYDFSSLSPLSTSEEGNTSPESILSTDSSINNKGNAPLTTSSPANKQNKVQSKNINDVSSKFKNGAISESKASVPEGDSGGSDYYSDSEYYYDSAYYYYDYNDTSDGNNTSTESDKSSTPQITSTILSETPTSPEQTTSPQDIFITTTSTPVDFATVTDASQTTDQTNYEEGGPNESEDDSDVYDTVGPDASQSYALAESNSNSGQMSPLAALTTDSDSNSFNRQQLQGFGLNNNPLPINNRNNAQGNARLLSQSSLRSPIPQANINRRGPSIGLNQSLQPQRIPNQNIQTFQSNVAGNRNFLRWPNNFGINRNNVQLPAGNGNNRGFGMSNNGNFNRFPLNQNQNGGNYGNMPLIGRNYGPQRMNGQNFQTGINNFNGINRFSDYYDE